MIVSLTQNFFDFIDALKEFDFLRQALLINLVTGVATAPLGVFLVLRRMSLMGDALSHALLPGVAFSYFFFGLSATAMTIGGFLAGSTIVLFTVWAQKHSPLKEESNFAAFYLLSLAIGVLAISMRGNSIDLMHILFGSPITATQEGLNLTIAVCSIVGILFWLWQKHFLLEIFDPTYLESRGFQPLTYQTLFLILVVACLVVSFQTNGTLLAMGQLVLPGIIGRLWSQNLRRIAGIAIIVSCIGSLLGLYVSFQFDWPLGPTTLVLWGLAYLTSLIFNPQQGLLRTFRHQKHYEN
jgi:zinc/manganese transport system permease protein